MLASDPCTSLSDGYKVKMTVKNCLNYTIKEENAREVMQKVGKKTDSCLILAKTLYDADVFSL